MIPNEPITLEKLKKLIEDMAPYGNNYTKVKMNERYFNHLILTGVATGIRDKRTRPIFIGVPIEFDNSIETFKFIKEGENEE